MINNVGLIIDELLQKINPIMIVSIALTIVLSVLSYYVLSKIISTALKEKFHQEIINTLRSLFRIVIGGLAVISILGSLGINVTGLIAGASIFALAVGFAAQTIISNLISGLFLISERVITVGDIIQVENFMGRVIAIGFRTTKLQTIDQNIISIPNSTLTSSSIINMTSGKEQMSLTIKQDIDIYSNLEMAKKLMLDVVKEVEGVIIDEENTPLVIVDRNAERWGLTLTLFVTVETSNWHQIRSRIIERIKQRFDSNSIIPPVSALARRNLEDIKRESKNVAEQ
jgi:small-conductance mechanosensitive channel